MDTTNWKWYSVQELFHPQKCKCSNATELLTPGNDIAYIGAKKSDNGVMAYVERVDTLVTEGNCIVFIGDGQGSVGYCLYQPVDFIGSTTLLAGYNENLNQYNAQFLIGILDCERYRYSFGRKYNKQAIEKTSILLPAKDKVTPDWQYMEEYVKNTLIPQLPEQARAVWNLTYDVQPKGKKKDLKMEKWKEFRIGDYFDSPYKATAYNAINMQEVSNNDRFAIAYVTRTDENNGIKCFLKKEDDMRYERGNAITLGDTTSTVFYQEQDFVCGDHMVVFRSKYLNKYTGMFIVTLLNRERYRYSYGRAYLKEALADTILRLPAVANPDGTYSPDWQFMEDYIKSLPYSKNI